VRATTPRQIEIYVTAEGATPFTDWLDALKDRRGRAKIRVRLDRLRLGHFGDCKPVGEGVTELRIDFGPGYRVYFGQDGPKVIVLLCGGDKGTQKEDIKNGKRYWADYKGLPYDTKRTNKKLSNNIA
jgi:putative addiction module killer protein